MKINSLEKLAALGMIAVFACAVVLSTAEVRAEAAAAEQAATENTIEMVYSN